MPKRRPVLITTRGFNFSLVAICSTLSLPCANSITARSVFMPISVVSREKIEQRGVLFSVLWAALKWQVQLCRALLLVLLAELNFLAFEFCQFFLSGAHISLARWCRDLRMFHHCPPVLCWLARSSASYSNLGNGGRFGLGKITDEQM